ncbi:MAG TPA: glycosyltransferase family 39 protein [Patescibacteria group bacterium]|nr:glycosyltransferase family 39 protein [Patescibacteria group bacterium]
MKSSGHSVFFSSKAKWLLLLWLVTLPLVNPWVRGDGVGYYAYIQALLIHGNLNLRDEWLHGNPSFLLNRTGADGRLDPAQFTANGHIADHFAVGPAMLWAPFLIPVHVAVLGLDHLGWHIPADGHSRPYRVAMALGTAFYGFLALWIAFLLAREYFGEQVALVATLGIWLGSSLIVYMYFNPSWAHAQAAFVVALFLWYWHRTRNERKPLQWIWLGLAGGLMLDVYYPNFVLLLLPLADALGSWRRLFFDAQARRTKWGRMAISHMLFAAAVVAAFLPTLVTRAVLYGSPFRTGYNEWWNWTAPFRWKVLFSSDHGLLSWTPILALAVVGLFVFWRRERRLGGLFLLVLLAFYYLISCYQYWNGLSSFGNRFFISLTVLFVLGLAALLDGWMRWMRGRAAAWRSACAVVALLALWNLGFVFQWGTHLVPARGPISWRSMVYNQVDVVPREATGQLRRYFLNRSAMMRRIEQQDVKTMEVRPGGPGGVSGETGRKWPASGRFE